MSGTRTITVTRTHTATYLSAKIVAAFVSLLEEIGLGAEALNHDWSSFEHAMRIWMNEGSLREATIEIYDKANNKLVGRFDVPVSYLGEAVVDVEFVHDLQTVRKAARKAAIGNGADLGFTIMVWNHPWHTAVGGWGPANARDTSHLGRRAMGQLASGPGMTCDLRYWTAR